MAKTLDELRKEIDTIDDELIKVLGKRVAIVREIGKIKKENHISALDEKRWEEVLERVLEKAKKNKISEELINNIYDHIHKAALKIENYE